MTDRTKAALALLIEPEMEMVLDPQRTESGLLR